MHPTVDILEQNFRNTQENIASVCHMVVDELYNLNLKNPKSQFDGIEELRERLRVISQSDRQNRQLQPGILITLLDLALDSTYSGYEALRIIRQLNMVEPVHGSQNQESLSMPQGFEEYENVLHIDMGAENFLKFSTRRQGNW